MPRTLGNGRVGPDPDAVIDAGAEMLGELAEDMAVDRRARLAGIDRQGNSRHGFLRRRRR
ncbi:MAG: hypothetical protein WDN06_12895 [Asticcacaulis sp.]